MLRKGLGRFLMQRAHTSFVTIAHHADFLFARDPGYHGTTGRSTHQIEVDWIGQPDVRTCRILDLRRCDSHNRQRMIGKADRPPENRTIATKQPLPVLMAEYNFSFRRDAPADGQPRSKHVEKGAIHVRHMNRLGAALECQIAGAALREDRRALDPGQLVSAGRTLNRPVAVMRTGAGSTRTVRSGAAYGSERRRTVSATLNTAAG